MKKFLPVLLVLITLLTSFDKQVNNQQKIISGKIVSGTNEGISSAYVYVVAGEEETLSISNGNFSLKTWQPLPLELVIEHSDFEKQKFVIKDARAPLTIKLSDRKN
jgi:hypothetical protein